MCQTRQMKEIILKNWKSPLSQKDNTAHRVLASEAWWMVKMNCLCSHRSMLCHGMNVSDGLRVWKQTISCFLACFLLLNYFHGRFDNVEAKSTRLSHVRLSEKRNVNCLSCSDDDGLSTLPYRTFFFFIFLPTFSWTTNFLIRNEQFSFFSLSQNFLAANAKCWWNTSLTAALNSVKYAGHVAPGMLLLSGEPCALEILRGAYSRSVLKPPAGMFISYVGE